jgi:magnesium transporter
MLTLFSPPSDPPASAIWLDLLDPSGEEQARAEAMVGHALPSRDALSEIETSSRLRSRDGVLYMSMPSASLRPTGEKAAVADGDPGYDPRDHAAGAPIGFILSRERLVTVRYTPLKGFDAVARKFEAGGGAPASGIEVFIEICEEIVDRMADGLEHLAEELAALSTDAFSVDDTKGRKPVRSNRLLRIQLRQVGRLGDRLSSVRDSLLGLARVASYATQNTQAWCEAPNKARMASVSADIASLNDYEAHLSNKVQFLLDAMVGLISIAQNDIFKVLTIVSIVGIPPTLVASMYGMNFKNMPELSWAWGYPYGLTLIALSAILPVVWFKIRGWF